MLLIQKKSVIFSIIIIFALSIYASKKFSNPLHPPGEKVAKRIGSLIKVKPEYEQKYIDLHRDIFPGFLDRIKKSNIRNYSIFILNGTLFSYYEYTGNDYEVDMNAAADSVTKEWRKLTEPMQVPLPTRKAGEYWAEMQQLICLGKEIRPFSNARRIGITAEVIPGKEEELKELCKNFPSDLESETNKENFQNANMFYKDGRVYYYYEYVGDDMGKSLSEISKNKIFKDFQDEMNKLLVAKENGYWEIMREIFHTD
jgi:L-rhamnose mutarotase